VNKRDRLLARIQERARKPQPGRLAPPKRRSYTNLSISLYEDQQAIADGLAEQLRAQGYSKAGRSLIIQEALVCLHERLLEDGITSAEQVAEFFRRNYLRRQRAHLIGVEK
jgi:hypothetical protein